MDPLFSGPVLKLQPARRHLHELKHFVSEYMGADEKPYVLSREVDPDGILKHIRVRVKKSIPDNIPCIIGDAIHNARSALDILAVALARRNGVSSPRELRDVTFPISNSKDHLELGSNKNLNKIKALAKDDIARIRALKPYKGGNDALWCLHKLDALDKHQVIMPVFGD